MAHSLSVCGKGHQTQVCLSKVPFSRGPHRPTLTFPGGLAFWCPCHHGRAIPELVLMEAVQLGSPPSCSMDLTFCSGS